MKRLINNVDIEEVIATESTQPVRSIDPMVAYELTQEKTEPLSSPFYPTQIPTNGKTDAGDTKN